MGFPRSAIILACRSADILAIDPPYTEISNTVGLEKDTRAARDHGFTAKCCLYPTQVSVVNDITVPDQNQVEWARTIKKGNVNNQKL